MVEQPIEESGDRCGVAQQLPPIIDRSVRGEDRGRAFVAAHDQLEEILSGGVRELAHAEIVDDQERDHGDFREVVLARAGERRLGEFFEQGVGFAIDDAIALENRGAADRLRQVTLPRPGGTNYIMPIVFRQSPCTTAGIRSRGKRCVCANGLGIVRVSMSSVSYLIEPSAPFPRGCSIRHPPGTRLDLHASR
jgi:hypothetical protein